MMDKLKFKGKMFKRISKFDYTFENIRDDNGK